MARLAKAGRGSEDWESHGGARERRESRGAGLSGGWVIARRQGCRGGGESRGRAQQALRVGDGGVGEL